MRRQAPWTGCLTIGSRRGLVRPLDPGIQSCYNRRMNSDWEEFRERPATGQRKTTPSVSILRSGKMGLNRAAFDLLGRPGAIVFAYDRARCAIGLRAATLGEPGAYTVNQRGSWSSWRVSGAAFLRRFSIEVGDKPSSLDARLEGDFLVIDLPGGETS